MSDQHFVGKVSVRALIVKDNKVLLSHDTHNDGIWELPGGRLHLNLNKLVPENLQ